MIAAVVLAAGSSRRMGEPKMALAWGETTVLGNVLRVLQAAGLQDIAVVTGADQQAVERISRDSSVRTVFNSGYGEGEMLSSLQVGLTAQMPEAEAALVVLGDQPAIKESTIRRVVAAHSDFGARLVVPSYRRRRGHPWLVARALWPALIGLQAPATARDFLDSLAAEITYVEVDTPSILKDIDTREQYLEARPQARQG